MIKDYDIVLCIVKTQKTYSSFILIMISKMIVDFALSVPDLTKDHIFPS